MALINYELCMVRECAKTIHFEFFFNSLMIETRTLKVTINSLRLFPYSVSSVGIFCVLV